MDYKVCELKKGVKLHEINVDKFKTNLTAIFFTTDLNRGNVTKNALISLLLRRGSKNMPSQEEISKNLEELYGATFDCGLDKTGDNQVLKFYIETINDKFLPQNDENMWKVSIEKLLEITLNPYLENNGFKEEYVEQEKQTLKQLIEGIKDNKARYALERCTQEVHKNDKFGLYKFGYVEDLEKLNGKNLYEYYKNIFLKECKVDVFASGDINQDITKIIEETEEFSELNTRDAKYHEIKLANIEMPKNEEIIEESMEVTQGKLVLGLDIDIHEEELKYDVMVYNSILGGSANSKMFQNVREKAHLAYVASSMYLRHKNNIFINCGIEFSNYEKTLKLIREQLEDMKNGIFSQEDLIDAKKGIIEAIKTIYDEQDSQITYYFGQELSKNNIKIEEYINKIEKITRQDVIDIAKLVYINTIYFLKN